MPYIIILMRISSIPGTKLFKRLVFSTVGTFPFRDVFRAIFFDFIRVSDIYSHRNKPPIYSVYTHFITITTVEGSVSRDKFGDKCNKTVVETKKQKVVARCVASDLLRSGYDFSIPELSHFCE